MKFLKFSIVVIFLLSVSCAAATFYLSTLRENEKAKRIYLESVKADLEKKVQAIESEKADLNQKLTDLELKNQDLAEQVEEERRNYQHAMDLIRDKDLDLENLRREAEEAHKAFENAQERNRELERILDELEVRMRQAEVQNAPPLPDAGYVEVNVEPVAAKAVSSAPIPTASQPGTFSASAKTKAVKTPATETFKEPEKKEAMQIASVTTPPKPPKKRRKFIFFGSSGNEEQKKEEVKKQEPKEQEPKKQEVSVAQVPKKEPAVNAAPKPSEKATVEVTPPPPPAVEPEIQKVAPAPKNEVKTVASELVKNETSVKTTQTIAAGSVLLVNRKYNFFVVNLGSKHGLGLDDVLSVRQNGQEIAKARVEKLYEDYSAAYIIEEKSDQPIGEGDAVTAV